MTKATKTIETLGLFNPSNGKTYTFKGFTPLRRISENCQNDGHTNCMSAPQDLVAMLGFEFAKNACCLCGCHFSKAGN
jgi:hypothetical protein